jgi:3D-(3,5/4)-trihydroxycyclohexane-1,2-dione acylhydrolase (decyclizing)
MGEIESFFMLQALAIATSVVYHAPSSAIAESCILLAHAWTIPMTTERETVRLTMAQALVRHLVAQRIIVDGIEHGLCGGVFAIFGHGNVTCLGEALYESRAVLPTWRGQNEQSMGFAAVAYAKANLRRRFMMATSSIGPGATNMVTAAAVAHTNRLPALFVSGDTYHHRLPNPVLQQLERFDDPTITVNDAFKPVTRYWDRITHPAQLIQSLPAAIGTMLDPADCGPAFIGLPQDVQGIAYDYPVAFFEPRLHYVRRVRPDSYEIGCAAALIKGAKRPLIIAGGGVQYSLATEQLTDFAARYGMPVVETIAGRGTLLHDDPYNCGPIGATGVESANTLAAQADVVLAIGTRLQDFTTSSWTAFDRDARIVGLNAARVDASKHLAQPVVGDARESLLALSTALGEWTADPGWLGLTRHLKYEWNERISQRTSPSSGVPSYAQVIGAINRLCTPNDRVVTAAGGLPAELNVNWRSKRSGSVDIEFGYSCMGYEIAGGLGARMAQVAFASEHEQQGDTIVLVGDGSYLLLNSDIYSSVIAGHKLIIVVCDNGGFAVIDKLQRYSGNASFNNLIADCKIAGKPVGVDFAMHARAMGALSETANGIAEFEAAFYRAKESKRTYVIDIKVDPYAWTKEERAWWEVGLPEVSQRPEVLTAATTINQGRSRQRRGI